MSTSTETERIKWKSFDRKKEEPVILSFDRFTIDGKPVCMAWYGSKDHDRMACHFLGTSNFGIQYHCMYIGEKIYGGNFIEPIENCPLWEKK